jgi:hypothetical protein
VFSAVLRVSGGGKLEQQPHLYVELLHVLEETKKRGGRQQTTAQPQVPVNMSEWSGSAAALAKPQQF